MNDSRQLDELGRTLQAVAERLSRDGEGVQVVHLQDLVGTVGDIRSRWKTTADHSVAPALAALATELGRGNDDASRRALHEACVLYAIMKGYGAENFGCPEKTWDSRRRELQRIIERDDAGNVPPPGAEPSIAPDAAHLVTINDKLKFRDRRLISRRTLVGEVLESLVDLLKHHTSEDLRAQLVFSLKLKVGANLEKLETQLTFGENLELLDVGWEPTLFAIIELDTRRGPIRNDRA